MKAPIHTEKHYLQTTLSTVAAGASLNVVCIDAVGVAAKTEGLSKVVSGAVVKAIYLEYWLINSSLNGFDIFTAGKYPSGLSAPNFAESVSLGTFDGKKNILHTHQGLSANDGVGNPIPIIKGWLKIPKGKQRFGLGDRFICAFANPAADDAVICGFALFKEYT